MKDQRRVAQWDIDTYSPLPGPYNFSAALHFRLTTPGGTLKGVNTGSSAVKPLLVFSATPFTPKLYGLIAM